MASGRAPTPGSPPFWTSELIYLDYNATAPLLPQARAAMEPWWGVPANPSAAHRLGRDAAMAVDRARQQVADLVGWPRDGVVFTSSASESNATVCATGRWAASAVEHPSVRAWAAAIVPVDEHGVIDVAALAELEGVDGISVMFANNETGVIQPVAEVIALARRRGLRVHVDASQAPGRVPLDALAGADFVTLASHKLGGPQGVGALCVARMTPPAPLVRGAAQERSWRAGTHNVAGIVGFGTAGVVAGAGCLPPTLRDRLERGLVALGGRVAGAGAPRLPNTSCVSFGGALAPDLVAALDLAGIAASAGSACASGAARPSSVLAAMAFGGSGVRFSLGSGTTEAEIEATLLAMARILPGFVDG